MSDAAAFFASKKKKKKAFKFNANLVDASSVTATVHVDAPALTTDQEAAAEPAVETSVPTIVEEPEANKEWDDEALAAATSSVRTAPGSSISEMKTQSKGGVDPDNIAEKLRVEETKAQLAAARIGMEREAQKLKEEREQKEKKKEEANKSRFGAAAAGMGGSGGKWVPSRLRSGAAGGGALPRMRMGAAAGGFGKVDTADEELFPDLAAADKILEKKEQANQPHFKPPKKTPVGGGASWATKMAKKAPAAKAPVEKEPEAKPEPAPTPVPSPAPAPAPVAAAPKIVKKATKKKKKDLSTFKPSS